MNGITLAAIYGRYRCWASARPAREWAMIALAAAILIVVVLLSLFLIGGDWGHLSGIVVLGAGLSQLGGWIGRVICRDGSTNVQRRPE